jgi:hypothetical protein
MLPGSFILRVVTPLNFTHLNNLITSDMQILHMVGSSITTEQPLGSL